MGKESGGKFSISTQYMDSFVFPLSENTVNVDFNQQFIPSQGISH